jgi:hypothetical protein
VLERIFGVKRAHAPVEPGQALEVIGEVGMPILMVARAMPMVRMTSRIRCFWPANTCSTWVRILERLLLALAVRSGSERPGLRRWWMWLLNMPSARNASFFLER